MYPGPIPSCVRAVVAQDTRSSIVAVGRRWAPMAIVYVSPSSGSWSVSATLAIACHPVLGRSSLIGTVSRCPFLNLTVASSPRMSATVTVLSTLV